MHILLLSTLFILFIQTDGFFFGLGGDNGGCSNCPCGTASPSCSMFCPQSHNQNCQNQGFTGYVPPVQQNFNNQGNFGNFGGQSQYTNFANSYQQPPAQQFQQQMNYPPRLPPYSPPSHFTNSYLPPPPPPPPPPRNPVYHPTHETRQLSLGHAPNNHNQYQSIPRPAPAPAGNHFNTVSQPGPNESYTVPHYTKQTITDEHAQIQSILEEHQKLVVPEIRTHTKQGTHHGAPSPSPFANQYQSISNPQTENVPETPVVEQMEMMTQTSSNYASTYKPMTEQEDTHLSLQPPSSKIYSITQTSDHISNETPSRKTEELSPEEIGKSIEDTYYEKSMTDEKLQITPIDEEKEEVFTKKENRPPIKTSMVTMSPNYDDKEYTEYLSSPILTANSVNEETTRLYGVTFQYIQETTTMQPNTMEYEIPVSNTYERQSSVVETTTTAYISVVPEVTTRTANYEQITPTGYEFKNENNEHSVEPKSSETEIGLEETIEEEGNSYTKFRDQKQLLPGDSKKKEVLFSTNHSEKDSYKRNAPDVPLDKCNNERLREIMNERMRPSASVSKQLIYASASTEFSGYSLNVICSRHSFSYIVVTSPIFCEHKKQNLTCFAFFQP